MTNRTEYWRARYKRRYQEEPGFRESEKERHKAWRARTYEQLKEERNRRRRERYVPRPKVVRPRLVAQKIAARPAKMEPRPKTRRPAELLTAYRNAHPNSQIKKLFPKGCPTLQELELVKARLNGNALAGTHRKSNPGTDTMAA